MTDIDNTNDGLLENGDTPEAELSPNENGDEPTSYYEAAESLIETCKENVWQIWAITATLLLAHAYQDAIKAAPSNVWGVTKGAVNYAYESVKSTGATVGGILGYPVDGAKKDEAEEENALK